MLRYLAVFRATSELMGRVFSFLIASVVDFPRTLRKADTNCIRRPLGSSISYQRRSCKIEERKNSGRVDCRYSPEVFITAVET